MSSIDFEDFYRICSDSNDGGVEEDSIMISSKNRHTTEANANTKAPSLEDWNASLDLYIPHKNKVITVVQQN